MACRGLPMRHRLAVDADRAADAAQHAEQRQQQLALALAVEAAEADDLALADRRSRCRAAGRPSAGSRRRAHAAAAPCRAAGFGGKTCLTRGRSSSGRSRRRSCVPLAKVSMCRPLRNTEQSSASSRRSRACGARCRGSPGPRRAAARAARRPSRRRRRSAPRSPRRGSGASGSRPSALAISTIWRRDSGRFPTSASGWTSSQPTRASSASARRRCARAVDQAEALRRVGDADVVGDRQVGHQRQLLEDADDAGRVGLGRGCAKRDRRAVEHDRRRSSGCTTPEMILISVDLPAPFSPSTAWMRRGAQAKSTLSSARDAAIALGDARHAREAADGRHGDIRTTWRRPAGDAAAAARARPAGTRLSGSPRSWP